MGAQDYNHSGQPGEKLPHYLYPENIYLAIYFCDMSEADGPTQVIPGACCAKNLLRAAFHPLVLGRAPPPFRRLSALSSFLASSERAKSGVQWA